MITNPSKILRVTPPSFKEGSLAEVIVFDPEEQWKVTEEIIQSKSKNTPLLGKTLKGKVKMIILQKTIYRADT